MRATRFVNLDYERPERLWGGKVTHEVSEGLTLTNGPPPASHEQARSLHKRYECTV